MESALSAGAGEPGLKLIETLGWTGRTFPRLPLHMARLAASAARLGWGCDPGAAEEALRQAAPDGAARLRLTLDAGGALEVQVGPMPSAVPPHPIPPPPGGREAPGPLAALPGAGPRRGSPPPGGEGMGAGGAPAWRIGLAGARLRSDDPWLSVKTTRRPAYDAARAALPPGLDEVIFLNERDEVCDGTITTVFFDRGQGMRTPPLSCGLLPGVLRAEMACPEEVLRVEDLPRARLWVGNSLRGLMPALWVG